MTKCGYCNVEGHNIRNCNDDSAILIRRRYRQVRTEAELDDLLSRYTSSMLSIVMISYNVRNLTLTKRQKLAFIKERWLSDQAIREEEEISNLIYRDLCIDTYQYPRYIIPANNEVEREFMAQRLSTICNHIVVSVNMITNNDIVRSNRIFLNIMNFLNMPTHLIIRIRDRLFRIVRNSEDAIQPPVELKIKTTLMPHIEDSECSICYDVKEQVVLNCNHSFCVDCIDSIAKARKKSFICCALCREEVTEFKVHTETSKVRCERQIISNA